MLAQSQAIVCKDRESPTHRDGRVRRLRRESRTRQGDSPCSTHACVRAQSCPTLCGPMDRSPPGSSAHGIFPERILECVAFSSSRGSSQPRSLLWFLRGQVDFITSEPPGKPFPTHALTLMGSLKDTGMGGGGSQELFIPRCLESPGNEASTLWILGEVVHKDCGPQTAVRVRVLSLGSGILHWSWVTWYLPERMLWLSL